MAHLKNLTDWTEKNERRKRKRNVVITGLHLKSDDVQTLKMEIERFFADKMEVNAVVVNVTKIRNDLFVVEMATLQDKISVLHKKMALKDKNIAVRVYSDRTTKERIMIMEMKKRARIETSMGNKVYMNQDTMYINDKKFVWDPDQEKLVPENGGCSSNFEKARPTTAETYPSIPTKNAIKRELVVKGMTLNLNNYERSKREMEKFFYDKLGVPATVESLKHISQNIIVVRLTSQASKLNILRRKSTLKWTLSKAVYIEPHRTQEEQTVQSKIECIKMKERRKGNQARAGYNKLYINNVLWAWNTARNNLINTETNDSYQDSSQPRY